MITPTRLYNILDLDFPHGIFNFGVSVLKPFAGPEDFLRFQSSLLVIIAGHFKFNYI